MRSGIDGNQSVYFSRRVSGDDDFTFLETVSQLRRGRTNYVYVEVLNESCQEKVLRQGSVVGSVHSVSAVIPMVGSSIGSSNFGIGKASDAGDQCKNLDEKYLWEL